MEKEKIMVKEQVEEEEEKEEKQEEEKNIKVREEGGSRVTILSYQLPCLYLSTPAGLVVFQEGPNQ